MEDFINKHRKVVIAGIIAVFLAIIGAAVYYFVWNSIYSANIDIMVAPYVAKVKVGENEFGVSGVHRIIPGDYNVEISAEGFVPLNLSLSVAKGETASIREYLEPKEENKNWYAEHEGDALVAGEIAYIKADEANRKLAEENPIMNVLPVAIEYYADNYSSYVKYNLRYEINEKSEITIIIDDYSGGNKELALKKLKTLQPDYEKYTIKYNDKTNERLF